MENNKNIEIHIVEALEKSLKYSKKDVPKSLLIKSDINKLILNGVTDWLIIVCSFLMFYNISYYFFPFFLIIAASRYHSFGVILHDAVHMPLRKKTLNVRFLEILVGYPIGTTLNAMRYHHLRHHKDNGTETDPYFKEGLDESKIKIILILLRTSVLVPFWFLRSICGNFAYYIPKIRQFYSAVFLQDRSNSNLIQHKEVIQCAFEERYLTIFLVFLIAVATQYFEIFLLCYVIPVIISGMLAGNRLIHEHNYIRIDDSGLTAILKTTNDNYLNGISRFVFAPRNIGYHIVHHLHPQVRWSRLPLLRAWYIHNFSSIYPS